jgi:hypothetical protein
MARSTHFRSVLLILCLGATNLPAQQGDVLPPLPTTYATAPPEPETLPPPPQLEWQPLTTSGSGGALNPPAALTDPLPQPQAALVPPPAPTIEAPLPGPPDPEEAELAKPEVETWRPESEFPQTSARQFNTLERALIAGPAPVVLRVQFSPLAAGKKVCLRPGQGVTIVPPNAVLTVSSSGECIITAQLHESFPQSHIIFYCNGIKTVLPLAHAPLAQVIAKEEESGGGQ